MRLIDADALIDAFRGYLVGKRCPDDGTLTCRLIENEVINKLPTVQPERKGTRLSTVCLMCKKPAVTFNTEDDIPYTNYSYCEDCLRKGLKLLREQKKNLQAQPERKDAIEKDVAVEAISDELMSRFDVSATYGYDFAEAVINRIEAMAKELERGEQG